MLWTGNLTSTPGSWHHGLNLIHAAPSMRGVQGPLWVASRPWLAKSECLNCLLDVEAFFFHALLFVLYSSPPIFLQINIFN